MHGELVMKYRDADLRVISSSGDRYRRLESGATVLKQLIERHQK